jgi:hypothetical protein
LSSGLNIVYCCVVHDVVPFPCASVKNRAHVEQYSPQYTPLPASNLVEFSGLNEHMWSNVRGLAG